jgi:hypothetical protein
MTKNGRKVCLAFGRRVLAECWLSVGRRDRGCADLSIFEQTPTRKLLAANEQ